MHTAPSRQGLLVLKHKNSIHLFWQPESGSSSLYLSESKDGQHFKPAIRFVSLTKGNGQKQFIGKRTIARTSFDAGEPIINLTETNEPGRFVKLGSTLSWRIQSQSSALTGPTVTLKVPRQGRRTSGYFIAFSSKQGRTLFSLRSSSDLSHFRQETVLLRSRPNSFDTKKLAPLSATYTDEHLILIYSAENKHGVPVLGAALFDRKDPSILVWRSATPLWTHPKHKPLTDERWIGGFSHKKYFWIYLQSQEFGIECFPVAEYWKAPRFIETKGIPLPLPPRPRGIPIILHRSRSNPIIEPRETHAWEAFATFNPAAIALNNKVHLLYRAQGYDGLSVLGHAVSANGITIDERDPKPAFVPAEAGTPLGKRSHPYGPASGWGTGGCEDPRIVAIGGRIYLTYTSFDGANPPGMALTSISKSDFLKKKWRWERPRLISRPGHIQKNWVLFPEKINGKYAILHGLSPKIRIEYFDSLTPLGRKQYMDSLASHGGRGFMESDRLHAWDNIVRGPGAPPLRTEHGWLMFYHGMDMRDPGKYKVGVMLLDLEHPETILHRAFEPVLEPETTYENEGHKRGVVFVCGAVIKEDTLLVYYGASDKSVAVASAHLGTFLHDLMHEKRPTLRKMNIRKYST